MKNSMEITFLASDISDRLIPIGTRPPAEGVCCLEDLAASLRELGLEIEIEPLPRRRARVRLRYPFEHAAKAARTRHAGRRVRYNPYESPVFDYDITAADALAWLEAHSVEEGMRALCRSSRSTYFRWLSRLRRNVEAANALNERRAAIGKPPYLPSLETALSEDFDY